MNAALNLQMLLGTAAGTFNVQYTKAIHWGFGDEIIHFGNAAASSTFSWVVVVVG
jgi:hypothetical protein